MIRKQLLTFALAGATGFVVDSGVLYGALALGAGHYLGRLLSFLAAVFVTWRINRRLTFPTRPGESAWHEWWRYLVAMSAGGVINLAAYSVVIARLPAAAWAPLLAVAFGTGCGLVFNFLSAKYWVFRKKS
ncbi:MULTISPECIES: GtrA family protein [Cupriavidus]|uniref:GtrA family protein n=1 Tax=Cupriavidus TaxID=106589 RepID=UPI003204A7A9